MRTMDYSMSYLMMIMKVALQDASLLQRIANQMMPLLKTWPIKLLLEK